MRWLKLIALSTVWPLFFVLVTFVHVGVSILAPARRWRLIGSVTRSLNSLFRILLNISIVLEGDTSRLRRGGQVFVSNHLGYVDGVVLGSLVPATYVTKKEVSRWPLLGHWTTLIGTVFVDRQRKEKLPQVVQKIAQRLKGGANVLLFPEGTSTNGERLLPFQSAFFASPLMARAPVVPVTLTYRSIDYHALSESNRDRVYWYGDMDFVGHFWGLLGLRHLEVSVRIHPAIETVHFRNDSRSRKQLSRACYRIIAGTNDAREQDDPGIAAGLQRSLGR